MGPGGLAAPTGIPRGSELCASASFPLLRSPPLATPAAIAALKKSVAKRGGARSPHELGRDAVQRALQHTSGKASDGAPDAVPLTYTWAASPGDESHKASKMQQHHVQNATAVRKS